MNITAQFQSLVNGSTHKGAHGQVGTSHDIRKEVWDAFTSLYPDTVTILIDGIEMTLKANHSLSGKTTSYFGTITRGACAYILPNTAGISRTKEPYIAINEGRVTLHGGGKYFTAIENSRVEIK